MHTVMIPCAGMGTRLPEVPGGQCVYCGRPATPDLLERNTLKKGGSRSMPAFRFPLCEECATLRDAWETYWVAPGGVGLLAGLAVYVYLGATGRVGWSMEEIVWAVMGACLLGTAVGGVGWLAGLIASRWDERVRLGRRIAKSADYSFVRCGPGRGVEDYCYKFEFANPDYARRFAETNRVGAAVFPDALPA